MKMECDFYPDRIFECRWHHHLIEKYLQCFTCQNDGKTKSFEEILQILFVSDKTDSKTPEDKDKELCEKIIIEILHYITENSHEQQIFQSELCFLLTVTKYVISDETCMINLNVKNVLQQLIYLTQHANREIKMHFLDVLLAALEHESGVKWMVVETKCWLYVYSILIDSDDGKNDDIQLIEKGNTFLTRLIDATTCYSKELCQDVIKTITEPLFNISNNLPKSTTTSGISISCSPPPQVPFYLSKHVNDILRPSSSCIVEILERLLKNDKSLALKHFVKYQIDKTCDKISQYSDDMEICLNLAKITIILSCFNLADYFDGIKCVNQDPLAISGIISIIERELHRNNFKVVLEIYYYAIKYLKWIECKLPNFLIQDKPVDIVTELAGLQLEPILLLGLKLKCTSIYTPNSDYSTRTGHLVHIIRQCSVQSLAIARDIRRKMPLFPIELYTLGIQLIVQTKDYYSEENIGAIFEGFLYSFEDLSNFTQTNSDQTKWDRTLLEDYVDNLLTATLIFQNMKFKTNDRLKALDLPQIMYDFLISFNWSAMIIVKSLTLMKESIWKRRSPCMSLLIDSADGLKDVGPMLNRKCYSTNWEIRNAVLDVVWTIAFHANKSFTSFKEILIESNLPELVSAIALTDPHPSVQATAFKCLQEMVPIESIGYDLYNKEFIEKVLNILNQNPASIVLTHLIGYIDVMYQVDENIDDETLFKIYKYLKYIALYNNDLNVMKAAVLFWRTVASKLFRIQGWLDCTFPPIVFSKRIVTMTRKEIQLRVYKALNELSQIGCLRVFYTHFLHMNVDSELYSALNEILGRFYFVFNGHEITPKSMSSIDKSMDVDLPSPISECLLSTAVDNNDDESEQLIQEIIDDTVMKIFPNNEDPPPSQHWSISQLNGINNSSNYIRPAQFVDLVLKLREGMTNEEKQLQNAAS